MNRPRLFTSSLAAAAVAATITLTAPSAQAADVASQCGAPTTVEHPAIAPTYELERLWFMVTPEETQSSEWLREQPADDGRGPWSLLGQRTVVDEDEVLPGVREETVVVREAYDEEVVDVPEHVVHHPAETEEQQVLVKDAWEETVTEKEAWDEIRTIKDAWDEVVIDTDDPAPYAYVNKHGRTEWKSTETWNGGDDPENDSGWNRDPSQDKKKTIHHDAETETIHHPAVTRVVQHPAEYKTVEVVVRDAWDEVVPATYKTVHHDAVTETVLVQVPGKPAVTHEEYRFQRVLPESRVERWAVESPGAGWQDSGQARDGRQLTEGSSAWIEEIPGTDACDEVGGPAVEDEDVNQGGGRHDVAAPEATPTDKVAGPQAAPAVTTGVLPNTGNGASLGMAAAGLGSLAAGAVLMMLSRRNRFSVN